jgi:hypothetical protein
MNAGLFCPMNGADERFCRFCKCHRPLSCFAQGGKAKRRVCLDHMRTMYRMRQTVEGGGTLSVEHFRLLKNAYQLFVRDAKLVFGGLKPNALRIHDLAEFIHKEGQFCVPRNPLEALSPSNLALVHTLEHRRALLRVWSTTRNAEVYAKTLACLT